MKRKLRRPGFPWRLLVHEYDGPGYGVAHHVAPGGSTQEGRYERRHVLPNNCEFDELAVGRWLHIEAMDSNRWWMDIGGVTVWVKADRDGRPIQVDVYGPKDYADPVEDVKYSCTWTEL